MKIRNVVMSLLAVGISSAAMAQVQLNASGTYLQTTGENNNRGLWGGGLGAKFFLGDHFALGGVVHSFPKKTSDITIGSTRYTTADVVTNAGASFDLLLNSKQSAIQPYIGTDAGVSWSSQTVSYTNNETQMFENKNTSTYFLLAPKAGVNIGLAPAFGLFGQAQYNFTFGDGEDVAINDVPNPFTTEPVSKYFTFDVGVYFRLQGAK